VTYRQNTELMIEAWHWNPRGTWSNAAKQEGYFTGSAEPTATRSYTRGHTRCLIAAPRWATATVGRADRWRPEVVLEEQSLPDQDIYGDEDRSIRSGIMIDLGDKVEINAIRIAWADPYARRYYIQFWTGEQQPFYNGINKGSWQTFPWALSRTARAARRL
jgi:hypothetical protein